MWIYTKCRQTAKSNADPIRVEPASKGGSPMYYRNLLVSGGSILTGDPQKPAAEAMLISCNRIVCIGSYNMVNSHPLATEALKLNLAGNTILPGLTDSHLHLASLAKQMQALSLNEASSLKEMLRMIKERASCMKPGEWIYGVRFDDSRWPHKRIPTRQDLDNLELENPVVILRICAHIHVANSLALQMAGMSAESDVLYEDQASPVTEKMKEQIYDPLKLKGTLEKACFTLASQGLTCVHTCSCSSYGMGEDIDLYRELKSEGKLPLRVIYYSDDRPEAGLISGNGDDWIRYGGFKMFLDGSLGGKTAALTLPYENESHNRGILNHTSEEVRQTMLEMHNRNIQTQVHAIGDAAVDQFIEGLEYIKTRTTEQSRDLRHRIVHLQVCRPPQMRSLSDLGAICDIQPCFVPSDIRITGERLGAQRQSWAYAWKDIIKAPLLATASSDAPVEPTDPFRGLWAAINRTDDNGYPEGGWRPDQKLTIEEALPLFTSNPWKAVNLADRFGILKEGFMADFVILDRDITQTPSQAIKDVRPVLTMVDGTVSYGRLEGWPSLL